ncbi:uncharacterized protein LOC124357809 [Homalodisca vitripennis]|uniref:uncharacterized protein LOC124357809 n=1 Tax=Homalodisca vitripennis TaxID=197043 RepID=UPI001EEBA8D0|nr:uncharacterized protein LOC124357809 [Homalodisca vitripennis]
MVSILVEGRGVFVYTTGLKRNIILYNSTTPPLYNLSKVSVPVSLHYGDNEPVGETHGKYLSRRYSRVRVEDHTTGLREILFCTIAQLHRCTTCPRSQFLYRCTMEITTCWRDPWT